MYVRALGTVPGTWLALKKSYEKPRQCITKQRHHFANKGPYSQSCGFSSSHVWMWELDHEEGWALKNWCFQIMMLEKILGQKEIKPVNPKGNLSWIYIGKTDAEAETPILWPPDVKNWLIGKEPDPGQDWKAGAEGGDRGWDGCVASLTQWTWVWASSRSWWWTGKPGVLQSMGSQRVGHDWAIELNWAGPITEEPTDKKTVDYKIDYIKHLPFLPWNRYSPLKL